MRPYAGGGLARCQRHLQQRRHGVRQGSGKHCSRSMRCRDLRPVQQQGRDDCADEQYRALQLQNRRHEVERMLARWRGARHSHRSAESGTGGATARRGRSCLGINSPNRMQRRFRAQRLPLTTVDMHECEAWYDLEVCAAIADTCVGKIVQKPSRQWRIPEAMRRGVRRTDQCFVWMLRMSRRACRDGRVNTSSRSNRPWKPVSQQLTAAAYRTTQGGVDCIHSVCGANHNDLPAVSER